MDETVGERVRRLRVEAGYARGASFARRLGIHRASLHGVESGRMAPWPRFRRQVADALGLREEDVFGRRVDATEDPPLPVLVMVGGATLTEILKHLAAGHLHERAEAPGRSTMAQGASGRLIPESTPPTTPKPTNAHRAGSREAERPER